VNPVVPEVMNLVAFRVMGNDVVVTLAAHSGQLQLNAYEPVEGQALMESQSLLFNTSKLFRTKCIDGITVNEKVLAHYMETTIGIVTALNPILGYDKATELAAEATKSGKGIMEVIREKHALTEQQIKDLLDPVKLTGLDKSSTRVVGFVASVRDPRKDTLRTEFALGEIHATRSQQRRGEAISDAVSLPGGLIAAAGADDSLRDAGLSYAIQTSSCGGALWIHASSTSSRFAACVQASLAGADHDGAQSIKSSCRVKEAVPDECCAKPSSDELSSHNAM
jgi:hypothetical protein